MIGRPIIWTEDKKKEIVHKFCVEIAKGKTVREIKREDVNNELPNRSTFYEWLIENKDFADQYARAKELMADEEFEEIKEIADDSSGDSIRVDNGEGVIIEKFNPVNIQRSKLKIEARQWMLSKAMPKKYGNKLDITSDNEKINTLPIFGENPLDKIKE